MSLTRANIEALLLRRVGALLTEADLDGSTVGTNADLADPIGWAVRQCGASVANFTSVADSDIAGVSTDDYDKLLDLAEYRAMQNISGNWSQVDLKVGPRQESFNQFRIAIEDRIGRKLKQLQQDYGFGQGTLEAGVISLDFMSKGTDTGDV